MAVTEGALTRGARWSIGANVALICGLGVLGAVLVLAVVQGLSYKFDLRADATADGRYTPSPAAASFLRGLERDVRIRFAFGRDEEIQRRTSDLAGRPDDRIYVTHYRPLVEDLARRVETVLNEWTTLSPRVYVETADADQNPRRVQEWAFEVQKKPGDLVNRVWMTCGSDERVLPAQRFVGVDWGFFPADPRLPPTPPRMDGRWRVQAELLEALRGLVVGRRTEVRLAAGKRSRVEADGESFAQTARYLATQGFSVGAWNLALGAPPQGGVFVLAAPGARLERAEIDALTAFEAAGGRLLLVGDPRTAETFDSVLEPHGLRFEDALVEDPQHGATADPRYLVSSGLFVGGHDVVRGLARRATLRLELARPIRDEGLKAPGAVREPILAASSEASAVPVEFDPATGVSKPVAGAKRAAGGAFLGLACERTTESGAKSRVVVVGGAGFLDRDALAAGVNLANREFLTNVLNWLADRSVSEGAPEPDRPGSRVEMRPDVASFVATLAVGVFPAALFLVGAAVFLRRRQ